MGGFCLCYVMLCAWSNAAGNTARKTAWGLVARLFGSLPGWCTPRFVRLGPKSATPTNHARARSAKKYRLVQRLICSGIH